MTHLEGEIKELEQKKNKTPLEKARLQRYKNIERKEAQQKKSQIDKVRNR